MMTRDALESLLASWLEPSAWRDVAPNGLQVEGKADVSRVVCGVTANMALIDHAVSVGADALVVHHGLFWGPGLNAIRGYLGARIRRLLAHDISLFAYHLPLDAHPTLGNNAGLADALELAPERTPFGDFKGQPVGLHGTLLAPVTLGALLERVEANVGPVRAAFGDQARTVRTVGMVTGGASDTHNAAVTAGLDVYITGEVTEYNQSIAVETGTAFIAAGHHNTERFGAMRLAEKLAHEGLEASFYDVENPA